MQSLYRVIKSAETNGNEVIPLPDIRVVKGSTQQNDTKEINDCHDMVSDTLLDARRKADKITKDAEAAAKKLLEDASKKASSIMNDAKENGYQDGYHNGYEAGYKEGYNYGINEASVEAANIRKDADIYIESCRSEVESYIKNKRQEIIELSISIAKQIINSEIMINPDIVNKIAEKVLSQATDKKHMILKVNPADFNIISNKRDDLSIYVENPNNLFIIADSNVTQGSVKAETPSGFIDGDINTQLELIAKNLLRN